MTKKFLSILAVSALLAQNLAFAKAGTSYSRSSSSSSSSSKSSGFGGSSSSKPSYTYSRSQTIGGTGANGAKATTQYSSTAQKPAPVASTTQSQPMKLDVTKPGATTVQPTRVATGTTSGPLAGSTSTTSTPSVTNNYYGSPRPAFSGYSYQPTPVMQQTSSGGMGWFGTATAVAGGVVGGSLISHMLFDKPQAAPSVVYQTMPNGQVVQQQMVNGQQTVTPVESMPSNVQAVGKTADGQPVYAVMPQKSEPGFLAKAFSMLLSLLLIVGILALLYYIGKKVFKMFTTHKAQESAVDRDKNLPRFAEMYKDIQYAVASTDMDFKAVVGGALCTNEVYDAFIGTRTENAEKGITNHVGDLTVEDVTTIKYETDDDTGDIYHTVKIRALMRDYTTNEEGDVIDGSKTEKSRTYDVWTFVSKDGKHWKLSKYEDYVAE